VGTIDQRLRHRRARYKLEGLAAYDYDLLVSGAEGGTDAATRLPETSIAGRFTVIGDDRAGAAGDVRPGELPETGGARLSAREGGPHAHHRRRDGRPCIRVPASSMEEGQP
jgi:hypothetical protein